MTVSIILGQKGHDIVTVKTEDSLDTVAKVLADKKIGAVMVLDADDKLAGIMSERDIVQRIAKGGADALKEPTSACMTVKIVSCDESETINEAMEKMTKGRFRHLPVMRDGELVGIISIGDVVKSKIEQAERDAEELKRYIAS